MNQIRYWANRIRGMGPMYHRVMQYMAGGMMNFTTETARERLESYWHDQKSSCYEEKELHEASGKYDCSVIISAYNTEKFIDACLKSVIEQITDFTVQMENIFYSSIRMIDYAGKMLFKNCLQWLFNMTRILLTEIMYLFR